MLAPPPSPVLLGPEAHARAAFTPRPWPAGLLILALLLPTELSFQLGSLRLSPYRLVLIAWLIPSCLTLFNGRFVKPCFADKAMLGFCIWTALAFSIRGGPAKGLESGGIFFIEAFGAYSLARVSITSAAAFRQLASWLFVGVCLLALVALPEMLTGKRIVHDVFGAIFGGRQDMLVEGRLGLARAYGPFDHPILYGTFCAAAFSLAWSCSSGWRDRLPLRMARGSIVTFAVLASLSSACVMAVMLQAALMAYRKVTGPIRGRWKYLSALLMLAYFAISMLSSRSGLKAVLWYATLSRETAVHRIMIWENATKSIAAKPLFGVGKLNWERPSWMPESVDSFWLVLSLDGGLPAVACLVSGLLWMLWKVGRLVRSHGALAQLQLAWVFTMIGLLFGGFTVHYWNNVFVLFFMLFGAGAWMLNQPETRGLPK